MPFVCAGEALIDLIQGHDGRFDACLGGAVFNFALALARQGVSTAYANPLSTDTFGQRLRQRLLDSSVTLLSAEPVPQPTSLAVVTLDVEGKPSYAFHRSDVADRRFEVLTLLPFLAQARALHLGCLALVPADIDRYLALMAAVCHGGGVVSVDANMRPTVEPHREAYAASVMRAVSQSHVLKVSDEDLLHLGLVTHEEDESALVNAAQQLLRENDQLHLVALTLGASGALLLTAHEAWRGTTPEGIRVSDTVGAGDCFIAALLAALDREGGGLTVCGLVQRRGQALRQALAHAMAAACINVSRVGCDPATWDETTALAASVRVRPL